MIRSSILTAAAVLALAPAVRADEGARKDAYGDPLPRGAVARLGTGRFTTYGYGQGAFTADFKSFAYTDDAQGVHVVELPSGRRPGKVEVEGTGGIEDMDLSPDGARLVAIHVDGNVRVHDLETGKTIQTMPGGGAAADPVAVTFTPDGRGGAWLGNDGVIRFFAVGDAKVHGTLRTEAPGAMLLELSPDGSLVATIDEADDPDTVRVHEVKTGKAGAKLEVAEDAPVSVVAFFPDGRRLAVGDTYGRVTVFDLKTHQMLWRFTDDIRGEVRALAIAPDGKTLAAGAVLLVVLDAGTGAKVREVNRHPYGVDALAYSPDGKTIGAWGSGRLRLIDAATGALTNVQGHEDPVVAVAYSPDGKHIATASEDGTARLWDVATAKEARRLGGGPMKGPVRSVAFSPDGKHVAAAVSVGISAWGEEDGLVHIFDAATGAEVRALGKHEWNVGGVAFAKDGRIVSFGPDVVRVVNAATGDPVAELARDMSAFVAAPSPDGKHVAVGVSEGPVRIFDIATGKVLHEIKVPSPPVGEGETEIQAGCGSLAFSPDGKRLALAPVGYASAHLFDIASGKAVWSIETGSVMSIELSPDGRLVAINNGDPVSFRDPATGAERGSIAAGTRIHGIAFAPDGKTIALACEDTSVLIYEVPSK